jgi:Glycerophosphoryl diester phosphodiesterase family
MLKISPSSRLAMITFCAMTLAVGRQAPAADSPEPLTRTHAHNDYEHRRPLFDALDQGFCSVEADIFLVDGKLLVGHTRSSLRPDRTLESLYLEPLKERVAKNGGRVYRSGPPFTLLIDVKTQGSRTYAVLRTVLERYRDMISNPLDSSASRRAINVVVSGERAVDDIEHDRSRLVGIDGRLTDLDSDKPANLFPMISDNWRMHFKWRGAGPMPAAEKDKLHLIVKKAHEHGRRVRFWSTPEKTEIWQALYDADVDFINTDNLAGLAHFLRDAAKKREGR